MEVFLRAIPRLTRCILSTHPMRKTSTDFIRKTISWNFSWNEFDGVYNRFSTNQHVSGTVLETWSKWRHIDEMLRPKESRKKWETFWTIWIFLIYRSTHLLTKFLVESSLLWIDTGFEGLDEALEDALTGPPRIFGEFLSILIFLGFFGLETSSGLRPGQSLPLPEAKNHFFYLLFYWYKFDWNQYLHLHYQKCLHRRALHFTKTSPIGFHSGFSVYISNSHIMVSKVIHVILSNRNICSIYWIEIMRLGFSPVAFYHRLFFKSREPFDSTCKDNAFNFERFFK